MDVEGEVAGHYNRSELTRQVLDALHQSGKDIAALRPEDLAGVDEFHFGWGPLTRELAPTLGLAPGMAVLDVGGGVGGPARHFAATYGCDVTGIDLTPAFVELANELNARTGLADRVRFVQGTALAMPFGTASFDLATMFHVGMNIADKPALFAELRRVLRPGGRFVVYDLMRKGEGDLPWPMPWAETEATSFVETPARYRALLEAAGFRVGRERDWTEFALAVAAQREARLAADGPPAVGLHQLMGPGGIDRLRSAGEAIRGGLIAPIEITAVLD